MKSEEQQNIPQDDGFESDKDANLQQKILDQINKHQQQRTKEIQDLKKDYAEYIPPGHNVIDVGKKYSLYPDMITGWVPKDSKCHPIPITVDLPILDALYNKLHIQSQSKIQNQINTSSTQQQPLSPTKPVQFNMVMCYFGPRYDNTYYAWYQMPFQFPYTNIQPPTDMKFTNRPFNGSHPTLHILQPNTLIFNSFFQNGNLDCVIKVGQLQYDLYLRVDSNTRGHFQWYNFQVKNMVKGTKYKFNICNLQKDQSLYNRGMKPYILSSKAKQKINRSWLQDGQNIKYQKKPSRSLNVLCQMHSHNHDSVCQMATYYKLTFQYGTIYQNDVVQMAYCIPYTYTNLRQYLETKRKKFQNRKFYIESRLCLSLGGLPLPLITINQQNINPLDQQTRIAEQKNMGGNMNLKGKKKCVIIGCRVHPGQSNSSYMMEGFIDFLCSNKIAAKNLRSKIQFKIVPMLNPDGVCFGNYRTGLSGKDFNRQYTNPDARLFPEIYHFKKLVIDYKKKYGSNFFMFLDFHGHSVRKNVFMYGPQNSIMDKYYYESRIFPKIVSKRTQMFRYYSCVFKIEESKKTTARSIFQKMHNIPLSFTIQASNSSYYDTNILKDFPFNAKMWLQMGIQIGYSLFQYLNIVIAAQKARVEKYQKLNKFHIGIKQQNNLRTSKLIQRKKEKKKGGQKIQDFNYGRVTRFDGQNDKNYDDDLFKYIYEQIEQSQAHKRNKLNKQQISKVFEEEDKINEGQSDNQGEQNDLQPEKLSFLYQAIKRKQYNDVNFQKSSNKRNIVSARSQQKELSETFKNQLIQSRAKSALGSNQEQYCRKLSQPRKSNQKVINLSFPSQLPSQIGEDSIRISAFKNTRIMDSQKKNPKTFQQFVTSYQKWEKCQRQQLKTAKTINAFYKSTQANKSQQINHNKNNTTLQTNKKSVFYQIKKSQPRLIKQRTQVQLNKQKQILRQYQSIQQKQEKSQKQRIYSPIRVKNIFF